MGENIMEKVNALGERLKMEGSEVGRKVTAGISSMSFKMKELFQQGGPASEAEKLVESATSESLSEPDWALNLELCDMINSERLSSVDLIRSLKRRLGVKTTTPRSQLLSLLLLETCVKNCEKAFSEVAAEHVLDDMVRLVDDPQTLLENRNKALTLIEAWGESTAELRYLPVFEQTYKSLRSRGVRFPGRDNESLAPIFTPARSVEASAASQPERTKEAFEVARNSIELLSAVLSSSAHEDATQDELARTLIEQCRQAQGRVVRIIEGAEENEAVLFEALNVNDDIQKLLAKCHHLQPSAEPQPAMIPVAVEPEESPRHHKDDLVRKHPSASASQPPRDDMMDDLDEMIFGKKDDLISF